MQAVRLALMLLFLGFCCVPVGAQQVPSFNRDIRPILSDRCFACHGPDSAKREADLRLDDRAAAIAGGAIVPGNPDDSAIIQRVLSTDADTVMPPPHAKLGTLSAGEVNLLREWIRGVSPAALSGSGGSWSDGAGE
ncbi:hypothetical protein E3A20_30320 [Planctomyces bekefii]|uniref:Cytochrome C Planctomycete-type domain-containing protein n=1 Tax=Planctomyces bekefii TaxID=1653850 RepID=A0A5C6LYX8_9PLAN|nr:hypothetical protein E3A20_30320 [Planctomyces bekefii]